MNASILPDTHASPSTSALLLGALGVSIDPALASPIYLLRVTAGRDVVLGRSALSENDSVTIGRGAAARELVPFGVSPLAPACADLRITATADALRIGLDLGDTGGVCDDDDTLLPIYVRPGARRRLLLDRLRLRRWTALDGGVEHAVVVGAPSAAPRTSLLQHWAARQIRPHVLDSVSAPGRAALRTAADPWDAFVCLPLAWVRAGRPFLLDASEARPRHWFEIPWCEQPASFAREAAAALQLNVHPFVDFVATTFEESELLRSGEWLSIPDRRDRPYHGRELHAICAVDTSGDEVRWDPDCVWSTEGELLERVPTEPGAVATFRLPRDRTWRLLATHRPTSAPALDSARVASASAGDGLAGGVSLEEVGTVEGIDARSQLCGGEASVALVRALLALQPLARRGDFIAALLDADVLGMRRWIDPRSIEVSVAAGRVGGVPARFASVRTRLVAGHELSRLDRQLAGAALSARLSERSAMHLPVVVEVLDHDE